MRKRLEEARLLYLSIQGIKNVGSGQMRFYKEKEIRSFGANNTAEHVFGIYGTNGSGKTAAIDVCRILKSLFAGLSPGNSKDADKYQGFRSFVDQRISKCDNQASITAQFYFKLNDVEYICTYSVEIHADSAGTDQMDTRITKEKMTYRYREINEDQKNRWSREIVLAEIDLDNSACQIQGCSKQEAKEFFKTAETVNGMAPLSSVLFMNPEGKNGLFTYLENDAAKTLIEAVQVFNEHYFFVVETDDFNVSLLKVMVLILSSEEETTSSHGKLPVFTGLHGKTKIAAEAFPSLQYCVKQISFVLNTLVQGLQIRIEKTNEYLQENGLSVIEFETRVVRNGIEYSLDCESEGIKRLISVLSVLRAFTEYKQIVLAIDEFDSGIFEFLFGELVESLQIEGQGQLIFTAHNLRGVEVLPYKQVYFSTLNPFNVYERQNAVMQNNNKRTTYMRNIVLGKDKGEDLGNLPTVAQIRSAFRKAKKLNG